jgi:3'-5' exoribonuclease
MDSTLRFADLVPGCVARGLARVLDAHGAVARTGSPYHRLVLGDPSGARLPARRFDAPDAPPAPGVVVDVEGVLEDFRGAACLKLTRCTVDAAAAAEAFWPRVPAWRLPALADLDSLLAAIADARLRAWVAACFPDEARTRLALMPAAVAHHGAAVGGLLAHVVRVARAALALAELAGPAVDRDVLLAAALLHDLGKLEELLPEPGAGLTERGLLVGHVVLGAVAAASAAASVGIDPDRVDAVLHAVLAAHGRLEHGAPVVPAIIEALLLRQADRAEAALEAGLAAVERAGPGAGWTPYLPAFGTRLRVPGSVPGADAVPRK